MCMCLKAENILHVWMIYGSELCSFKSNLKHEILQVLKS